MIETLIFLLFALLAVASSLVVVMHRNPVYSTMSLVVTLFSVAVLFVLLGAPFIAAIQILVYTGAIVVLFLFVVMLLNITREESAGPQQKVQMGGAVLGALLFGGMLALFFWST
ncbi:MAG TPA: NADH-quinone oxidoreductase subunit J, partial [Thermoanaerobaculia bacterium]|nr:NADH-quinone oxidoreductase subunit J [Thermoanaerobaculia bacterium]